MNIDPLRASTIAAGSTPIRTIGTEQDRTAEQLGAQQRSVYYETKATEAAGIGQPDGEDHETADRDADGRRLLEITSQAQSETGSQKSAEQRKSKDPTMQSGNFLDLMG